MNTLKKDSVMKKASTLWSRSARSKTWRTRFVNAGFYLALISGAATLAGPDQSLSSENLKPPTDLRIYVYDSFIGKDGLGTWIKPRFEKTCGCRIKWIEVGGAGQLAKRIELDMKRGKDIGDLAIGIDQFSLRQIESHVVPVSDKKVSGLEKVERSLRLSLAFVPIDYSWMTWIYDGGELKTTPSNSAVPISKDPKSLTELATQPWSKKVILEDPRTSAPGLVFLMHVFDVMGREGARKYLRSMRKQWLALPSSWEAAYGLFLKQEAPLVWSYATSQAYHREHGDLPMPRSRYRAVAIQEGHPIQVEGLVWISGERPSQIEKWRTQFTETLLAIDSQKEVTKRQWMFPARMDAPLPSSYSEIDRPLSLRGKIPSIPTPTAAEIQRNIDEWLEIQRQRE